jgi:hypothetical protein
MKITGTGTFFLAPYGFRIKRSFIPDLDQKKIFPEPDPGGKKAPDTGYATLSEQI